MAMPERREIVKGVEYYGAVLKGGPIEAWRTVEAPKPEGAVLVGTGEYVPEAEYKKLSPAEQAYLKKRGVAAFNAEQERTNRQQVKEYEETKAFVEQQQAQQERWYQENVVEVGPAKESILLTQFKTLSETAQNLLKRVGIEEYNRQIKLKATVTGDQAFGQLQSEGKIPSNAVFESYDSSTGEVTYEVPQPSTPAPTLTGEQAFVQLKREGKIPANAVFKSYNPSTSEVSYEVPAPPLTGEQAFAQLKSEGKVPEGATFKGFDEKTGSVSYTLVNPIIYLRNHPGDVAGLVKRGYDTTTATQINSALVNTKGYWDSQGGIDAHRYMRMNPDKIGDLYALGLTDEGVKKIAADNDRPLSKEAFEQQYFADRGWEWMSPFVRAATELVSREDRQRNANRFNAAALAYIKVYGTREYYRSMYTQAGAMMVPALRALYPEVGLKDITATEWAFSILVPATIAMGAVAPVVGPLAGIALRGGATLGGVAITSLMGVGTAVNWDRMSTPEKVIAVSVTVLSALGTATAFRGTVQSIQDFVKVQPTLAAAKTAGIEHSEMVNALVKANKMASQRALVDANTATKVNSAITASKTADQAFIIRLSNLDRVSTKNLARFEKLSGYKGLTNVVKEVAAAKAALQNAWDRVEGVKISPGPQQWLSVREIEALSDLQVARDNFFRTMDKFGQVTKVRYTSAPSPVWDTPIATTEKMIAELTKEINKPGRVIVSKSYVTDVEQLKILQNNLEYYLYQKASGEFIYNEPPATWSMSWESAGDAFVKELDEFLKGSGRYSPEFTAKQRTADAANARLELDYYNRMGFWPGGSPRYPHPGLQPAGATARAAVATLEGSPEALGILGPENVLVLKPQVVPVAAISRVTVAAPGVALSMPQVVVVPAGLAGITLRADFVAAMEPQDFEKMFGTAVTIRAVDPQVQKVVEKTLPQVATIQQVDTVSGVIIEVPKIEGARWFNPSEAVEVAKKVEVYGYVQQLLRVVEDASTQASVLTVNEQAVTEAVATQIAQRLVTIEDPAVREQVMQELQLSVSPALQQQIEQQTQQQIEQQTQQQVRTQTQQQVRTQTQVKTQVQTRAQLRTRTPVRTGVRTTVKIVTPIISFIPLIPAEEGPKKLGLAYPEGTAVWKMGIVWKIIPPPYDAKKPISSREPPEGVEVTEGTPQETLTFIGGVLPMENISFDLGVTDGFIDVANQTIHFTGYGEETDVGLRLPEPTKGLTLRQVPPVRMYPRPIRRKRVATKVAIRRKEVKPRVRSTWL